MRVCGKTVKPIVEWAQVLILLNVNFQAMVQRSLYTIHIKHFIKFETTCIEIF